jgi:hypothetical protein
MRSPGNPFVRVLPFPLAEPAPAFFITGSTDPRREDENLNRPKNVPGIAFEVVDTGEPIRPADSPCAG